MNEPPAFSVRVPVELVEQIARRSAELVIEQLDSDDGRTSSPYMTVDEAAELIRCKPQRIYELLSAGHLTRVKEGGRVLVIRKDLEQRLQLGGRLGSRRVPR